MPRPYHPCSIANFFIRRMVEDGNALTTMQVNHLVTLAGIGDRRMVVLPDDSAREKELVNMVGDFPVYLPPDYSFGYRTLYDAMEQWGRGPIMRPLRESDVGGVHKSPFEFLPPFDKEDIAILEDVLTAWRGTSVRDMATYIRFHHPRWPETELA